MEKKTIGKFIAVLRKANGMTQKDLGDKLFVSDKTVSRWERDECTPELSLIPAIAEIFGITTDELLRGEKNNPDTLIEDEPKLSAKAEKQFKAMIFGQKRKFGNLSLISVGISLFGLIVGMIINLGFSKGLISFFVTSIFLMASTICQICFTANTRISASEDDDYRELTDTANSAFVQKSISVCLVNFIIFSFSLPLVTVIDGRNFGLTFGQWLIYGLTFAIIATLVAYFIYHFYVLPSLIKRNLLVFDQKTKIRTAYKRRLIIRLSAFSTAIALLLGIAILVVNNMGNRSFADEVVLESPEEFKEYMESSYDKNKYSDGDWHFDNEGNQVGSAIIPDDENKEPFKEYDVLLDKQGNVLCEYYYHSGLYARIEYNIDSDNRCPITVYTREAMIEANGVVEDIKSMLTFAIFAEIAIFAGIYIIKVAKKKN
ncbi:MAG: helix-turn-helix transcriptional regulator [Clostridia bacterium]|nr:helix-turn-helix transcriptional regulator [Clostridia bacterium]